MAKTCTKCGTLKPIRDFGVHRSHKDGHASHCKACINERYAKKREDPVFNRMRNDYRIRTRHYPANKARELRHAEAYREKYPEKMAAKVAFAKALRTGKLVRPKKCSKCSASPKGRDGRSLIHGHHHNGYANPLDVIWLCAQCHSDEHNRDRRLADKIEGTAP